MKKIIVSVTLLSFVFMFFSGCASHNEQAVNTNNVKRDWAEEFWGRRNEIAPRLWDDTKTTFSEPNNLWLLGMAGAASIAMHNTVADDEIQDSVENHRAIDGFFSESLNWAGSPPAHFAAAGLWYALSVNSNNTLNEERSWTMLSALTVNSLVTVGLKAARDNTNPNGDKWAWPSGHTSSSFCVAAVLDEFYGPKIGIPAYVLAGFVGYRMVEEGDHWMSDAVFGAALGWSVGHSVAGKHMKMEVAGFDVTPLSATIDGEPAAGVNFVKRF